MSGIALLGMMGMLVLPLLAVAALLVYATISSSERTGLHRGALLARWIGAVAAVVLTIGIVALSLQGTWPSGRLGLGALTGTSLLIGVTALVLAILVGELTLPARSASQRYGLLAPRDSRALVSRPALMNAAVSATALIAYALFTTAVASPDDQGRPGRSLAHTGVDGFTSGAYGPFPGQWYTVPVLVALGVLALTGIGALVIVVRRRPSADPHDLLLRRRSVTSLLGAIAVGTGLTAQVLAMHGLLGFLRVAQPEYQEMVLGVAGTVISVAVAIVGLLSAVLGAVMVCVPAAIARRIPDSANRARTGKPGSRGPAAGTSAPDLPSRAVGAPSDGAEAERPMERLSGPHGQGSPLAGWTAPVREGR